MEIDTLYNVGELVSYTDYRGKLMSNRIEAIYITVGQTFARTSTWVENKKSNVTVDITYKLENVPCGYLLKEDSLIKINKEVEEESNA